SGFFWQFSNCSMSVTMALRAAMNSCNSSTWAAKAADADWREGWDCSGVLLTRLLLQRPAAIEPDQAQRQKAGEQTVPSRAVRVYKILGCSLSSAGVRPRNTSSQE